MSAPWPAVIPVGELARYVRSLLTRDPRLARVTVAGELSNFKGRHPNGSWYFDLKDQEAVLNCVVWGDAHVAVPRELTNGTQVHVSGRVSTFPKRSAYQLIVEEVRAVGQGDLHARYEELRERLQREGLFALERKRALPRYPRRIAVVTSSAAAAYQDFLRTIASHAPYVQVTLVETAVQGRDAAAGIAAALDRASRLGVDAIAVIRGGGSFEDLFAFNEEIVVRAIARAAVPVVAGIGHESDVTLADFAADLREPTPTAAARAMAPSRKELLARIEHLGGRLLRTRVTVVDQRRQRVDYALDDVLRALRSSIAGERHRLTQLGGRLAARSPRTRLAVERGRLVTAQRLLRRLAERIVAPGQQTLRALQGRLGALDPAAVLERGYAIVMHEGRVVREAASVPIGSPIEARLARGTLVARVEGSTHG